MRRPPSRIRKRAPSRIGAPPVDEPTAPPRRFDAGDDAIRHLVHMPSEVMLVVEREWAAATSAVPHAELFNVVTAMALDAAHELAPRAGPVSITFSDGREVVLQEAERRALAIRMRHRGVFNAGRALLDAFMNGIDARRGMNAIKRFTR